MPSTFTGDTAEQIALELAEVEWELAKTKRDQTKIRYNASAARNAITQGRPATTVLTSLCEGTLDAALISLPAAGATAIPIYGRDESYRRPARIIGELISAEHKVRRVCVAADSTR